MPFTPAHPAIILPLLRTRPNLVSGTALVIGSMAPDFEYFLKMRVNSEFSHTLPAVLYFNIPITIMLAIGFHSVVKKNLIENLPVYFQYRLDGLKNFDFTHYFKKNFLAVILSAGIGACSHIFWDSFTHNDGYFAQRISFYKHVFIPFDGVRYPLFYALQHISTITGLSVIFLYIILLKHSKEVATVKPSILYWLALIVIMVFVLFLRFNFSDHVIELGNFVVSSITSFIIASIVCGVIKFNKAELR